MTTKIRKLSLSALIHELDIVFGDFIKLRDTRNGVINCFICGQRVPRNEAEVMHFIGRAKMSTRFHEQNCHTGCHECNCMDSDHQVKYLVRMHEVYTSDEVLYLTRQSNSLQKFMPFEISSMIAEYKRKIVELKKSKGL